MRGVLLLLVVAAAGGVAVWLWCAGSAPPVTLPGDPEKAAAVAPADLMREPGRAGPEGDIAGGDVQPADTGLGDPARRRVEGEPVSAQRVWVMDSNRGDHTFQHIENGADVPENIRVETGMSADEEAALRAVLVDEDRRLATALRAFAATLEDFEPTADEVAGADTYRLFQMVTSHQGIFLEMAPFFQNMDDDVQRAFYEERRPWTDFFDEDSMVIRLCKTVHKVRAESYRKMAERGVDTDTLDKMRARYLLPGHFRYGGTNRFEFGPALR